MTMMVVVVVMMMMGMMIRMMMMNTKNDHNNDYDYYDNDDEDDDERCEPEFSASSGSWVQFAVDRNVTDFHLSLSDRNGSPYCCVPRSIIVVPV